jgi:signal transduction histidine kinase
VLSIVSREIGGILRTYDLLLSSKKRISELATLAELGKVLTSSSEPKLLLENITLITAKALNALFTTIKLDQAFLRLDVQRFTSGIIDAAIEERVTELEGEARQTKKSVSLTDFPLEGPASSSRFSLYSTPIISKERILGTMTLCRRREQHELSIDEDQQYLVTTVANYIASGLEASLLSIKLRDVLKELGDAQRRLIEHEKLRSLGEMTANIAHEIKNPLVIIGGFTKRLAKTLQLDDRENRYIDIIIKEVARLEAILNEILSYVKETPLLLETCSVNALLDEMLYLLTSDPAWGQVGIAKVYDGAGPSVICDVQQIKQVFINILLNAFEAMGGQGTITIRTERTTYQDHPFVALSFTDTGGGIDPALLDNIFNPFFTTKERGSGLGLAISNKIIMHHRGRIEVKNKVGEGVTFIIYLPESTN